MTDPPPFYPAEALADHDADPDAQGCYALELGAPDDFRAAWADEYDVEPPAPLCDASGRFYLGWASTLRDRLADHVRGDVRRVGLLSVCPPERVARVWPGVDPDRETGLAMDFSRERPDAVVYCNGDCF